MISRSLSLFPEASLQGQASHIAIAFLIGEKTTQKLKGFFLIAIQIIPFRLMHFFLHGVKIVDFGTNADGFFEFLYLISNNHLFFTPDTLCQILAGDVAVYSNCW